MDPWTPLEARARHCPHCAATGIRRRRLLAGGLGAAALAACASPEDRRAPETAAGRIDVHHHFTPPTWLEATRGRGDRLAAIWSVEKSLADMEAAGVATAMLSVTLPGVELPDIGRDAVRRLARECNEYGARLVADHPGRFGLFALLPMLDTEAALNEISYAIDTLHADGIGLLTSYGGKWLGDAQFFPIMEELNRRRLVVYTHPTVADCCTNLQPNVPTSMIENGTDTTRAIASILFDGNAQRFRNIRWIFSHAGGTMPILVERFVRYRPAADVAAELQRYTYDTAQVANVAAMSALTKIVPVSQIVFGTDYPYRTSIDHVRGLRDAGVFSDGDLRAIERGNALRLLPRLATLR